MADEDEDSTLLCGSKGLITLDEQHHYVRAKQQVDASDAECGRYNILLDEVRQQLWQCRERLQVLSSRREQAAAQARHAAHTGRHASLGYLRDRLAGLEANVAQQQHRRHWLTHRLVTLEKYAAAAAFDDGKLVSTKFFVNEMEKDFERRKQAQKSCYIQREEKLAKIYEDKVRRREERSRRTLRTMAAREDQLRRQAEDAAARMDVHVSNTLKTLHKQHKQQLLASERQRQRRSDAVRQFARQLEYTREVLRVQQQLPARAPGEAAGEHSALSSGTQKLQAHLEQRRATRAAAEQCRVDTAARQRDNTRRIVARLVQEERRRLQSPRPPPAPLRPRRPGRSTRPRSLPPLTAESGQLPDSTTGIEQSASPDSGGAGEEAGRSAETTVSAIARPTDSASADGLTDSAGQHEDMHTLSSPDSSGSSTPPRGPTSDAHGRARASRLSSGDLERLQHLLETSAKGGGGDDEGDDLGDEGSLGGSLGSVGRQWMKRRPDMPVERPPVTSDPCPFSWKPDVIEFKDFQVGWTYYRRVSIVNLSRTRSSCRYIGLFEHNYYQLEQPLAESLRVHFQPPGFLGTGLAAKLELEFTPRMLGDGECLVRFQAPNGEFQVPVRFVAQRAEPRLDRRAVEFGDLVLGTRVKRSVVLRNTGSKGCRFTVRPLVPTPTGSAEEERTESQRQVTSAAAEHSAVAVDRPGRAPRGGTAGSVGAVAITIAPRGGTAGSVGAVVPISSSPDGAAVVSTSPTSSPAPATNDSPAPATTASPALASGSAGNSGASSSAGPAASTTSPEPAVTTSTEQQPTSAKTATDIVSSILDQLFDRLPIIDFDGGLGVCGSGEGELPAGGRARLHLGCVADLEGAWRQQFVVEFDDPNCEPFTLTASYSGHEFPISVRNPHLSLDICLCGLTYWDTFEIVNTGKVASRVRTVVPDDMKPFVDIQGSPALVQADNSFKVKIFFKPKRSLLSPPHRFFDPATHILDFPVSFHVDAGSLGASLGGARGAPIVGSVQAAVSSNHVWLKPERVEFGRVTLLESACRRVQLTNGGLTVQQCHFTGLPDSVTVQPGNGGAVLLPGETVPLDVIFSPSVSGQHQFSLVVETLDGGRATVTCHGLATTPPLSLSATSIKLSGVPVQGEKKAAVYVQCPKVPLAEEKFFAMGGSFEFQPPDGIPVAIHPMVGFVPYKQSRRVEVTVSPILDPTEVRITASLLRYEQLEMERAAEPEVSAKGDKNKKKGRKKSAERPQMILCPEPSTIHPGSDLYREAQQVLLRTYEPATYRYVIPCCVRHGDTGQESSGPCDVLYLEVVCTTAAPHLVPASSLCLDFGPRVLRAPAYLEVALEGAGEGPLRPRASALDPHGPFRLVEPLREVPPGERSVARVCYTPERLSQELEFWNITGGNTNLRYALYGRGVKQEFSFTPEDGIINMGKAKLGKASKKQITVTNECEAPLEFAVELVPAPPLLPADPEVKSRGSGSARGDRRSGRREPEPQPALAAAWAVSAQRLEVGPYRTATLEVLLTPTEEALYEAQLVLRLFKRLDELVFTATGKTPGYKAPKVEKSAKEKDGKKKSAEKSAGHSAEKSGKGKKKK
ncbi:cilia- and flagella-associated protein 74-like [Amphibalanus amphitrite]|uniref:cilia- and flagella-associated protein 74-like n=1 Tax=Amphibalanus amphitrite TaxID=1232801 RepID=UPI001C916D65|nr:cilia- and flagella-associated protein 74-like [Amphibalanus amphitrite]XP_043238342.1 cilia- and flagella-associated protein 74-like [Amphibalanus amphitrite]XP_043238343.1 cilia- and flagella-associated protein 74-like [Amphibalanus amphitrite]XP_043238344.1 cilia- and flagella-associated protein 74-like [Amphibalanus amphitrite]